METKSFQERVLDALPFLGTEGRALFDEFFATARPAGLNAGSFISMEGDMCSTFAVVLEGVARVYKTGSSGREITLYRIRSGEGCVLTASCIVGRSEFPAYAVAETDMSVALLGAADFRSWVARFPEWQQFVFRLVSGRLVSVIEVVEEVAFQRLDARIISHLLHAAGDHNRVRTTHERIADDLGSSREVVSRVLKDLEKAGFVALSRGQVKLLDPKRLRGFTSECS
ncbi:MAG: Crp/Fnr family transcriptional regulator [Rhodothermia bacterium]|nr:Crp/Fnr family transcriptional regulator [Rhodothermia bacterium]